MLPYLKSILFLLYKITYLLTIVSQVNQLNRSLTSGYLAATSTSTDIVNIIITTTAAITATTTTIAAVATTAATTAAATTAVLNFLITIFMRFIDIEE